jgi:hypothetical protein
MPRIYKKWLKARNARSVAQAPRMDAALALGEWATKMAKGRVAWKQMNSHHRPFPRGIADQQRSAAL